MAHASPTVVRVRPAVAQKKPLQRQATPTALSFEGMPTAPYQVFQGQPNSTLAVVTGTVLRSVLLGAGLYAAGIRDPAKLASGALLASASYSFFSLAHHGHLEYAKRTS